MASAPPRVARDDPRRGSRRAKWGSRWIWRVSRARRAGAS
ncbi:hypothetical protein DB32_001501 [Sandaracinus amylolyticus]|uniref:Uncharacterized protein n=1 Tax=Sandaracinus amylolyticus TaxID=927083 RepID=A0A0F6W0U0_9BACT|nr:hypothetical protein DB32_001501 [Sandaracinus amylolyticus]